MQEEVDEWLTNLVKSELGEEVELSDLEDPGFYHDPGLVFDVWRAMENWGVLPRAGGYLDQDEYLMRDVKLMRAWHVRKWYELAPHARARTQWHADSGKPLFNFDDL